MSLLFAGTDVFAQTSDSLQRYYTQERIVTKSGWLSGDNAAGLIFNNASLSTVGVGYRFEEGVLGNVNGGRRKYAAKLDAESYSRINDFSLYGNVGYGYTSDIDRSWTGNTDLYTSSMPIGEATPGNTRNETYFIGAGASYEVGRWAIGVLGTYENRSLAKRKDARNKTNYMRLNVSPGVVFSSKVVNMGLNFNYKRTTESIAYASFGTNQNNGTIYFFEGLWFYSSEALNNEYESGTEYKGAAYKGAYQIELLLGRSVKFFNQFSVEYSKMERYHQMRNMRLGDQEGLCYRYLGILNITGESVDHRLSADVSFEGLLKYNNLQKMEMDPNTNTVLYKQYGRFLKFTQLQHNVDANYDIFVKRNAWSSSWIFSLAYKYYERKSEYTISPAMYTQDIYISRFMLGVTKNFMINSSCWVDVKLKGGYMFGGGTKLYVVSPEDVQIENIHHNVELLNHEYNYLTNDRFSVEAGIRYNHYIKSHSLGLYVDLQCKTEEGVTGLFDGKYRNTIGATLGLNF